jgi:lipopolysaccharide transport system permease protein
VSLHQLPTESTVTRPLDTSPLAEPRARSAPPIPDTDAEQLTVIDGGSEFRGLQLRELWEARELVAFLIWRDVKLRYRQTALGVAWAVLQPLLTMLVFTVFFGRLAGVPSDGVPYALFSFTALVPWTLFSFGLTQATHSVVGSQQLITKVYFPRLAIPLAAVLSGVVDFLLACALLLLMLGWFGIRPTVNIVWLPLFASLAFMTALGAGLWLSALNVSYRDIRYTVPFLTQLWLFVTPMAGVVEGFRWSLLGTTHTSPGMMVVSVVVALVMVLSGALYFQRVERSFADVI